MLLKNNADINLVDKDGRTSLHMACFNGNLKVLKLLIHYGANVNIADRTGSTALHIAAQNQDIDILPCLISNGGNVNLQDQKGLTPLHISCYNGDINIVQKLLESDADVKMLSEGGVDSLTVAVANGYYNISDELLKKGVHILGMNFPYLLQSVQCKSIISQILDKYSDVLTYKNSDGQSLLHISLLEKTTQWTDFLLSKGDLIKFSDKEGNLTFFYAIENGSQNIIELFLQEDLSEAMRIECLRMARMKGREDIASRLFKKYPSLLSNMNGSDYRMLPKLLRTHCVFNKITENALNSRKYIDIYSIILADLPDELWNLHKSTVPCLSPENCTTSECNWLEEKTIIDEVSYGNIADLSPLEIWPLLFYSDNPILKGLHRSDFICLTKDIITLKDVIGNTILHYLCLTENKSFFFTLHHLWSIENEDLFHTPPVQNMAKIRTLINMQNLAGCTPLHYAVKNPAFFRLLVKLGAEIGIKDKSGHVAEHYRP
ncbi:ankyrin-3-like [Saccostrea cucullata]|uniref:ankyrin-3-like n=1 Tax=Saccostrea cuccullata TaxID=36930 RepID=UPI002ED2AF25